MLVYSRKISKNYAFEISAFHMIRSFKDGISFFQFDVCLDLYSGDHNPKFHIVLIILNIKVFETDIYNINHE